MSSTQQDDFYAMLGITESATKKEIKEAFAKVQNAYDTLFDGRKRKAYDRKRAKNGEVRFLNQLELSLSGRKNAGQGWRRSEGARLCGEGGKAGRVGADDERALWYFWSRPLLWK